jgi:hypothetical protein
MIYGNPGKEPALNVVIKQTEETIGAPPTIPSWDAYFLEKSVKKFACEAVAPNPGGFVVYPSAPLDYHYLFQTGTAIPDQEDVLAGRKILVIKGCVGYETFRAAHYSWFCFFWPATLFDPPDAEGARLCPRGTNGAS